MITTDLGAAYAPQTVISPTRLAYRVPLAPIAPLVTAPSLPAMSPAPSAAYARQPAPVRPAITTPVSADVYQPAKTYTLPNYGYAAPQAAPNPYGASRSKQVDYYPGYGPGATATEPTVETPAEAIPAGSMEASLQAQAAAATPWYKRPIVWGIGAAVLVGILLLRK